MKRLALILALAMPAAAQIVVTPNVPTSANLVNDPFPVLVGSTRQINVNIGNGIIASDKLFPTGYASGTNTPISGSGYVSGDVGSYLTVVQAGSSGTATVQITGVTGGGISSVALTPTVAGTGYGTSDPNVGTGTTGGSGTGAKLLIKTTECSSPTYACTVNWTGTGTGGATVTFTDVNNTAATSISGGLPTVQVNIGGTAGTCSQTPAQGTVGPYTLSCSSYVTVTAQSTDDVTKTGAFTFFVYPDCPAGGIAANGTNCVIVAPNYQQSYQGTYISLQSWVTGHVNETGTWAITTTPSGGNGSLADTTYRDALFSTGTVTGRYTICYTSNADNTASNCGIIYVSPNAAPSYAATPQLTQPHECYPDPALAGPDYEVGPGQAYTTISSLPNWNTFIPGTIVRVHPGTYAEYFQIKNSGTPGQPIHWCAIADSSGNLPTIEGSGAVGQADTTIQLDGFGLAIIWPGPPTPYGYWQSGSGGPSYIDITGFHFAHAGPLYSFVPPAGGTAVPYVAGAACIYDASGSYQDFSGNEYDTCTNGFFSAANANHAWSAITQIVTSKGDRITGSGIKGDSLRHQIYGQSIYQLWEGTRLDNYTTGADGSNYKDRGVESFFRYGYLASGPLRMFDHVELQDNAAYTTLETYFQVGGMYYYGDQGGAQLIAWLQESAQKSFDYGNMVFAGSSEYATHYLADNGGSMAARNGTLYQYFNTYDSAGVTYDNGSGGDSYNPYYPQRFATANNIYWSVSTVYAMNKYETFIGIPSTNLFHTGAMCIGSYSGSTCTVPGNITGGSLNAGTAHGWGAGCDSNPCYWPLTNPLNPHQYNLTAPNFLLTSTQPYDSTTMAPVTSSAAISAGSALTGLMAQNPVRFQYSANLNSLTARTDTFYSNPTIGAVQGSPPPVLLTVAVTPNPGSVSVGGNLQMTATCGYSGGSYTNCTSSVTWSSSAPSYGTINSSGQVTGVAAGSTLISGVVDGVTSNNATIAVFVQPTAFLAGTMETGSQH